MRQGPASHAVLHQRDWVSMARATFGTYRQKLFTAFGTRPARTGSRSRRWRRSLVAAHRHSSPDGLLDSRQWCCLRAGITVLTNTDGYVTPGNLDNQIHEPPSCLAGA